jgi:polysaccharide export outer membrane protein
MNSKFLLTILFMMQAMVMSLVGQIQAGRAVQIYVSGVPSEEKARIDAIYPVSDSGNINMPFIGGIRAAGLRAEQLAASLESHYKSAQIYRNPTFQVIDSSDKTVNEQKVHVGGYVRSPGPKPFTPGLTLWQAIQAAGGANEFGAMKRVKVTRQGRMKSYDATKAQFQQIPLEPEDTIEIPQKNMWGQ